MHTQIPPEAEAAWASLLERLKSSIPELAEEFTARVTSIPAYSSATIEDGELATTAVEVLELVLDAIADPTTYQRVQKYATDLGERRAEQGIPVEALTSAVRMDFPTIWSKLLELADDELRPLLAFQVEAVWKVVDDYAAACYASYMAARMRTAQFEVSMRKEFMAALFTPEGQIREVQERFARVFAAPADTAYAIIAVNGRASQQMREAVRAPHRYLHEASSHCFLFWPVSDNFLQDPHEIPAELATEQCGLALSPDGLGGIATASRRALFLADHLSPDDTGPLTLEHNWPRLARRPFSSPGFEFAKSIDTALDEARPGESERIRETVMSFLNTGSVSESAEELYAHRNTVLNRLRRFTELTGIDLHIPSQAAQVVVAWLG